MARLKSQTQPDGLGGRQSLAKLSRRLAGLEIDDEPLAAIDREREVALRYAQLLAGGGDCGAELDRGIHHIFPIGKISCFRRQGKRYLPDREEFQHD